MILWKDWAGAISHGIAQVSDDDLVQAAKLIQQSDLVVTAGNGGSSALASHAAQAIAKPGYQAGGGRGAVCVSDNIPTLTAHANDGGWSNAFMEVARPFFDQGRCTLLAISSSGKSENIVRLAKFAQERGVRVIALTGFQGEPLRSLGTISLHVNSDDYEVVEVVHMAWIHRIQHNFRVLQSKVR